MLCIREKRTRARKQVYSQGLLNAWLELMHIDRFLLVMTVFVCFILCLVHALMEACQSESNGLAGPITVSFLTESLTNLGHHLYSSCKLHTYVDATQFGRHFAAMRSLTQNLAGAGCCVYVHKACLNV